MEQKRIPKKGFRWNPPGKRKQGRPKMGAFKKMTLTREIADREAKEIISWRKRSGCIILNG